MRLQAVILLILVASATSSTARAELTSPEVGWQAELSQDFHNVSGTMTILDDDTIQVDDFTFDGGGITVYFYLGMEDTAAAFDSGLSIGEELYGTVFDGSQAPLVIDLPAGNTLEGWNAISVWCVAAGVSFGSGTFMTVSEPIDGDYNVDGVVNPADYTVWRDNLGAPYTAADYDVWKTNYGATSSSTAIAVPEPPVILLMMIGTLVLNAVRPGLAR